MAVIPFLNKNKNKTQNFSVLKEGDVFLSIDIGTELLKGLLCRVTSAGVEILGASKVWQQHHAMRSGVIQNIDTVSSNLELVYNDLLSVLRNNSKYANLSPPSTVILGVAGELVNGEPCVVSYDRESDATIPITEDEEQGIIENIRENVIVSGVDEMAKRFNVSPEDIIPLHVDLCAVEVGTLRVPSMVGYKGRIVKLYFNSVFAPYTFVDSIVSVVKRLGLDVLTVVAQPFAVAKSFKSFSDIQFDGIFIDIGGGTTDIAVVRQGTIIGSYMFAFGGRVFTDRISSAMNIDYRFSENRKIKYSEGKLESHLMSAVKDIIRADVSLWADGVRLALSECTDIDSLPNNIFLCGGGCLLPDIKEVILAYPWKRYLPFLKHPVAKILDLSDLSNCIDISGKIDGPLFITPVAIAKYAWDIFAKPRYHLNLKL